MPRERRLKTWGWNQHSSKRKAPGLAPQPWHLHLIYIHAYIHEGGKGNWGSNTP